MDIPRKKAQDQFNQQNNLIVRDYLLPEVRSLEDRKDLQSIKQAMQLPKVTDRGATQSNDILYGILKDIYYKQDPLFDKKDDFVFGST